MIVKRKSNSATQAWLPRAQGEQPALAGLLDLIVRGFWNIRGGINPAKLALVNRLRLSLTFNLGAQLRTTGGEPLGALC